MATFAEHAAGWNYCGSWKAETAPNDFGSIMGYPAKHMVVLNNWKPVAYFDTRAEAELDAAKRNYAHGSYPLPYGLLGQ